MDIRKYIVGALLFALLMYGPVDDSWPAWLAIRLGYLVGIPVLVWFILGRISPSWVVDGPTKDRIDRSLAGVISGALAVFALNLPETLSRSNQHYAFFFGSFFSVLAFWYSVRRPEKHAP